MSHDEWYTPKELFQSLNVTFDLDVASPGKDLCNVPALKVFTKKQDGLRQEWHGFVWMNPPYSNPGPWADKWLQHANGLALMLFTKSRWQKALWDSPETKLIQLQPPKFDVLDEKPRQLGFPVILWGIGEQAIKAMINSGLGRVR